MANHIVSKEYILQDVIAYVFQFISFQQVQQVSRVSKTFKFAADVQLPYVNEMASRIQRCYRRWRGRRTFLMEIRGPTRDLYVHSWTLPPSIWTKYFSTIGKKFGKALFGSYLRRFIFSNPNPSPSYWGNVCIQMTMMLTSWADLLPEETELLEKYTHYYNRYGSCIATREDVINLCNQILIPFMDRDSYSHVYYITRLLFGHNAPLIWENYRPVTIDFKFLYTDDVDYDWDVLTYGFSW